MTIDKEDIRRTFSIFHDGTICGFEKESNQLKLKIDCYYLSERINPKFECFYLDLIGLKELDFTPWSENGLPRKSISDLEAIRQLEYNIFTCKIENGKYQIDVEIEQPKTALIGGSLNFDCKGIKFMTNQWTKWLLSNYQN